MENAKIFAEVLDPKALEQFESAMAQPFSVKGALMPDAHAGYALPIGAVVATDGVIVPSWIGYDIGCGMCAVHTTFSRFAVTVNAQNIFDAIYENIPVGFCHNNRDSNWDYLDIPRTSVLSDIFAKNGLRQLASLGSGNHFIEVGYDTNDAVCIIVHSGSRGIGHAVATHYMKLASGDGKAREGHFGFSVGSQNGQDYISDMNFCLAFALENRIQIIERVCQAIEQFCGGWRDPECINRNHNHAEFKDGLWIHRKGATHAEAGMMGVIPGNMRDGSFIVQGKGNPDALWSSSHGAGRVLGRKDAQRTLSMDQFGETMRGIVAKVDADTLDESPFAYKDIFEVMRQQSDMVEIKQHVRPIINIKG
ncbi:RtcB family protein [Oryzomonas rubra]|uniref:3'-phosphate/5'-hydroxy nucleic acid ligase n=1 Tax=Oryzomonas rubra TaxID=2509454 RepID=A0A5A9X742_9BACT|nr:RtcB family protein [Oryzomonas rubra]KAA0888790.1 RtcB family protein [Oryzomonas rubra]